MYAVVNSVLRFDVDFFLFVSKVLIDQIKKLRMYSCNRLCVCIFDLRSNHAVFFLGIIYMLPFGTHSLLNAQSSAIFM